VFGVLVSDERHCVAYQITVLCVLGGGGGATLPETSAETSRSAPGPAQWVPADFASAV